MLNLGMLPEESCCLICNKPTDHICGVWAVCERVEPAAETHRSWLVHVLLILFIGLFFYIVILAYLLRRDSRNEERGRDVRLRLPLRVCPDCTLQLKDYEKLKQTVWSVAVYDELFDKYPETELALEAERKGVTL
jgi:hypothetical protein